MAYKETAEREFRLPMGSKEITVLEVRLPDTEPVPEVGDYYSTLFWLCNEAPFHAVVSLKNGIDYVVRLSEKNDERRVLDAYRLLGYNRKAGKAYLQEVPHMRTFLHKRISQEPPKVTRIE